ncbi:uncharacterized protein ACRADG_004360 [Cochliomyia hominivorax]
MYFSHKIILFLFIFKIGKIYCDGKIYTSEKNNTYFIDNEYKYTWFDAYCKCLSLNMTLASIDTSAKAEEISTLILSTMKRKLLWIGGIASRYPDDSKYIWITTGKQITSTFWERGYPSFSGSSNQYCILYGFTSNMTWANFSCTDKNGFICEEHPRDTKYKQTVTEMENQLKEFQQHLANQEQLKLNLTNLQQELMRQKELEQQQNELIQQLQQQLQQIMKIDLNLKQSNETQNDDDLVRKYLFQWSKIFEKPTNNVAELLQKQHELQSASENNKQPHGLIYQFQHNTYFQINTQKSSNGIN